MLKVTCPLCEKEVIVNMHISYPKINFHRDGFDNKIGYSAVAKGRAICPACGTEFVKLFESEITPSDVIELALRREIHV